MSRLPYKVLLLFFFAAVVLRPGIVPAQVKEGKTFIRGMKVLRHGEQLELSMSFPEVFTQRLRYLLSNGFTNRILVDVLLLVDKRGVPLARGMLQYTILYDIWEERFHIREEGPTGKREIQLRSTKDLEQTCGAIRSLPLANMLNLPGGVEYRLEVLITVNPTLPEKIREYMSNPDGGGKISSGRSFFARTPFIDEKAFRADAVYVYRSPRFQLPPEK